MDFHGHAHKPCVELHVKRHGFPTDMLTKAAQNNAKQPKAAQSSPKAAPQSSLKPPRTAQNSLTQQNHRFACICVHFYDTLTPPSYKRPCFTDVSDQDMHFVSIFTINLIRRP